MFHAFAPLSDAAQALCGENTPAARQGTAPVQQALLHNGGNGLPHELAAARERDLSAAAAKALASLENARGQHRDHRNSRRRLAEGQSIGSGQGQAPANTRSAAG